MLDEHRILHNTDKDTSACGIIYNLYMLVSRYEMGNLHIAKTAVTLLFAKPVFTLGNVVALGIVLAAFEISAGTTVLFMGSIYGFLVMFMNQSVMQKLEDN